MMARRLAHLALGGAVALALAGLTVSFPSARAASPLPTGPSVAVFGQQWQPWGTENLGTSQVSVGGYGCALTAAAMLLQDYGVNTNPGALNQWLIQNGGYLDQDLLVWGAVAQAAQAQGVQLSYQGWQNYSATAVQDSLAQGNPVIAQVTLDGNMHFVLITGESSDGTLWINDPWYGDHTTFQSRYGDPATGIQSIRLYSGTPLAAPQLGSMVPGAPVSVTGGQAGLGSGGTGYQLLVLPDTLPTSQWTSGTPAAVTSWNPGQVTFTAPQPLQAGSVVLETPSGQPNYWFPYTVQGQTAVSLFSLSPSTGVAAGGTAVTLSGSGLVAPLQVTFGSQPATSVSVVSSTEAQAVSPPGTGSDPVEVSDWMGSAGSGTAFSYTGGVTQAAFQGLAPARICDTRPGNPSQLSGAAAQCLGKTLSAGAPLVIQVAGLGGAPSSGILAAVLNVTVTGPSTAGYLTVYPAGQPVPLASNLNFGAGETVANLVQVGVSSQGQVALVTSAALANVVVDLEGYVANSSSPGLGLFDPLSPTRICDTRSSSLPTNQCTGKTLGPGATLPVQVTGLAGVPAGAQAVAANITVTGTTSTGYLTVFPSGSPPTASNLNWMAGQTVANLVVVQLGPQGQLNLFNSQGSTQAIVDVLGYYTSSGGSGTSFHPLATPQRICDTRSSSLPANQCTGKTLGPGATLPVQVTGLAGVPSGAQAVVVNVTVTDTTSAGYLTVFPSGSPPLASTVNWAAGSTVPNLAIAELSPTGGLELYNSQGSTDVILDVLGWYS